MKYIFLILISFIVKNISAVELSCLFEEVHQTGDTHQGAIIVKDQKFQDLASEWDKKFVEIIKIQRK